MDKIIRIEEDQLETYMKVSENKILTLNGRTKLKSKVYGDKILVSPLTGKPCYHYRLEAYRKLPNKLFHIVTLHSKEPVYIQIKENIYVKAKRINYKFKPTTKIMNPQEFKQILKSTLDFKDEIEAREWCLYTKARYLIQICKFGSAIPDENGKIRYETYYHFNILGLI